MVPVPADPRWLEILKASGWQTTAIAFAAALLIYGNSKRLLPVGLEPWMIQTATVAFVVCACLSLASMGAAIAKAGKGPKENIYRLWSSRRAKRRVEQMIPQLTPTEREIIGYLLAHNQPMFTGAPDGGHANTLISKRIVVSGLLRGQVSHVSDVPFQIPEHVWEVLMKHKTEFPYDAQREGPHPWRVHWMQR